MTKKVLPPKQRPWLPDRQDIVWIDCNPQAGIADINPGNTRQIT